MKKILWTAGVLLCSKFLNADPFPIIEEALVAPKAGVLVESKTPKGIKTWLVCDPNSAIVSVVWSLKNGWLYDAPGKEGSAGLWASLMVDDRVEYNWKEIPQALENIGGNFSVDVGTTHIFFQATFPAINIEEYQNVLKKIFLNSNFSQSSFSKSRNYLSGRQGMLDQSAASLAGDLFYKKLYPNHLFSYLVDPDYKGLSAIRLQDMRQYADNNFSKDNLHVTAVGNITSPQLEEFVDGILGNVQQSRHETRVVEKPTVSSLAGVFYIEKDEKQSTIRFGVRCPGSNQIEWPAISLLNTVLGIGGSSRLFKILRRKLGLCYTSQSWMVRIGTEEASFNGSFTTNQENTQESIDALFMLLKNLQTKGISAKELEEAKNTLMEQLTISMTSVSESAEILENFQIYGFGPDAVEKVKNSYKNLTLEHVNAVARAYLKPENFTIVCVGPVEPVNSLMNSDETSKTAAV